MLASRTSDLARVARVAIVSDRTHIKLITPEPVLQRLLIAFAQVKAGDTPKNVLSEIRHIIYSLIE